MIINTKEKKNELKEMRLCFFSGILRLHAGTFPLRSGHERFSTVTTTPQIEVQESEMGWLPPNFFRYLSVFISRPSLLNSGTV
jgi:hypothetical protein